MWDNALVAIIVIVCGIWILRLVWRQITCSGKAPGCQCDSCPGCGPQTTDSSAPDLPPRSGDRTTPGHTERPESS